MKLKIKICGMRNPDNIRETACLNPDMLGFIFYPGSPRYAGETLKPDILFNIDEKIKKVGVFVNAEHDKIIRVIKKYSLDIIQLHGDESPETCSRLNDTGTEIIKAFNINEFSDFELCEKYLKYTKYFLFDSSSTKYGGSGKKFDWDLLEKYNMSHPFFLSGGIGPDDTEEILKIKNPAFYGIDLNSGFEIYPGVKEIEKLKTFISVMHNITNHERNIYSR
jgi:phosphoribosylanthranilate isomerase